MNFKKQILRLFFCCLFAQILFFDPAFTQQEGKKRLAVLKIVYDESFSAEEKENINRSLYNQLAQDKRFSVMTETEVREKLLSLQMDIDKLEASDSTYMKAGQLLEVSYVLIGEILNIGGFVEDTFRVVKMPQGAGKRYSDGKTIDRYIQERIPVVVDSIMVAMELDSGFPTPDSTIVISDGTEESPVIEEDEKQEGKSPLRWIAIGGGVAVGGILAAILSSSGSDGGGTSLPPSSPTGLPRPPDAE